MATLAVRPYKVSALYRAHETLGARWVEEGEWRLVESFGDPRTEADRVRQSAGLQDVSAIGKLDLKGGEVEQAVAGVARDGLVSVLRLTSQHILLLTPPGREREVAEAISRASSERCAHVTDVTSALAAFALVGPRARDVLAKLTSLDLRAQVFPDGACAQGGFANVHVILQRADWGSLLAYRLLVKRELGEYSWQVIQETGASLGLVPFGLAAERLLRGVTSVTS